jgi:septum formation protein
MRLVLASASPARLGLLRAAGLAPEVVVSGVDEEGIAAATVPDLVTVLARLKAEAVAAGRNIAGDSLVLGCDSLLEFDGEPLGKPLDAGVATQRWRRMRGRSGTLHTGHHLIDVGGGTSAAAVSSTEVHFAPVTDVEITAYVGSGEPLAVAGGFTLDGLGAPFIERIDGDPSTVIGLSLPTLRRLLTEVGRSIVDLWSPTS